jgi:hypothetical protein
MISSIVSCALQSLRVLIELNLQRYALSAETWDGDGVLVIRGNKCYMKDMDGKE